MADRRVKVILEADAGRMVAGFRQAEASVKGFASSVEKNRASWDRIGDTAMIAGGAIVAGLGLAAKAAIDWESAWAGVAKTVDGSPEQMAELEAGLRGLARELPATHEEIAGVAEAAGQLGVAQEDILGFTETAIALGESTNLSAEEAATSLAQFSNVMGTVAREGVEGYEKLGSTLVELGNNGASTERDIMQMALRLAGAGQQIGATEADILAMANALSSVGIEAQLGGGAMSRALLKMNTAVIGGGDELEKFAEIAGMSATEFASAWREDPVAATSEFVGGLGRISASGGDASAALDEVGLSGTQNAQVLLRAAGASDLMTDSLSMGAEAWQKNSALQQEAAKRYETDAARMQVSWNRVKDAMIGFGADIAPVLAGVAESVASLADWFGRLPGPVKTFVSSLAGISGGALLLGGAAIKAVGFAQDLGGALSDVGLRMDRIGGKGARTAEMMYGLDRGARAAAKGFAVLAAARVAADTLQDDDLSVGVQQLTADVLDSSDAVGVLNDAIKQNADRSFEADSAVQSLGDAARIAFDPTWMETFGHKNDQFWKGLTFGIIDGQSAVDDATETFEYMDDVLTNMVNNGNADQAQEVFGKWAAELNAAGYSTEEIMKKLPGFMEATAGAGNAASDAADGTKELAGDLTGTEQAAEAAEEAIESLTSQIEQLGGGLRAERAAQRDFSDAVKEAGEIATLSASEQSAALDDMSAKALDVASAQVEMGRSSAVVAGDLATAREQIIQAGMDAGRSRAFMEDYADAMGLIPEDVDTMITAEGVGQAKLSIMDLDSTIELLNGKTVTVKEEGANPSKGRVLELDGAVVGLTPGKTVNVTEIGATAAGDRVIRFRGEIYKVKGTNVEVTEHGATAAGSRADAFRRKIEAIDAKNVEVTEHGADSARGRVTNLDNAIEGTDGKNVNVRANVHGTAAVGALAGAIGGVQSKTVTVTAIGAKIGSWMNADGGMYSNVGGFHQTFADGGFASIGSQQSQIRAAGGAGITWAEDGAGPWESFISGHPAKAARSKSIWLETGKRLGMIQAFADGGMREHAGRHYVTPTPRVTVRAPAAPQPVPAGPSAAQMERAMTRAVSTLRPVVHINGRDFKGVMQRTNNDRKGR